MKRLVVLLLLMSPSTANAMDPAEFGRRVQAALNSRKEDLAVKKARREHDADQEAMAVLCNSPKSPYRGWMYLDHHSRFTQARVLKVSPEYVWLYINPKSSVNRKGYLQSSTIMRLTPNTEQLTIRKRRVELTLAEQVAVWETANKYLAKDPERKAQWPEESLKKPIKRKPPRVP